MKSIGRIIDALYRDADETVAAARVDPGTVRKGRRGICWDLRAVSGWTGRRFRWVWAPSGSRVTKPHNVAVGIEPSAPPSFWPTLAHARHT